MLYRDTVIQQGRSYRGQARAEGIYGTPPGDLAEEPVGAIQFSPVMPGSESLEAQTIGSLSGMLMLAPPGTIERRYAIAHALRARAAARTNAAPATCWVGDRAVASCDLPLSAVADQDVTTIARSGRIRCRRPSSPSRPCSAAIASPGS